MVKYIRLVDPIVYIRTKDKAIKNNMRKARKLHKKGMHEHEKGNEETAEYYYRRARELREKAQDQW